MWPMSNATSATPPQIMLAWIAAHNTYTRELTRPESRSQGSEECAFAAVSKKALRCSKWHGTPQTTDARARRHPPRALSPVRIEDRIHHKDGDNNSDEKDDSREGPHCPDREVELPERAELACSRNATAIVTSRLHRRTSPQIIVNGAN
jgi:hypothetical protein